MGDDRVATHWVLERSDERAFGLVGRLQSGDAVATQDIRLRGHGWKYSTNCIMLYVRSRLQ